jgi:divalent metal cation (Fe/Co/Zn/Cd) transporter
MPRPVRRLLVSFIAVMAAFLIGAVAIAKIISLVDSPHNAARDLENALGFWPLILLAVIVITVGLAATSIGRRAPDRPEDRLTKSRSPL